jgi:ABC-type cobalamin/Fe3+-siderophores transport system ATPase subunit
MLVIENLTASYAALSAISNISFTLAKGARVGIFGHNGAGKTTLLECVVGAHAPSQGRVVYDGTYCGRQYRRNGAAGDRICAARSQRVSQPVGRTKFEDCGFVV